MEPFTTALVAALSSGAMAAGKDVATQAIKDGYKALKDFVSRHVGSAKPAIEALETEMRKDRPDAALEEQLVAKTLCDLAPSEEATQLIARLVGAIDAEGAPALIDVERLRVARNFLVEDVELSGGLLRTKEITVEQGDFTIKGIRQQSETKKKSSE